MPVYVEILGIHIASFSRGKVGKVSVNYVSGKYVFFHAGNFDSGKMCGKQIPKFSRLTTDNGNSVNWVFFSICSGEGEGDGNWIPYKCQARYSYWVGWPFRKCPQLGELVSTLSLSSAAPQPSIFFLYFFDLLTYISGKFANQTLWVHYQSVGMISGYLGVRVNSWEIAAYHVHEFFLPGLRKSCHPR